MIGIDKKEDNLVKYLFNQYAFEDSEVYIQTFWYCLKINNIELVLFCLQNNYIDIEEIKDYNENTPLMYSVIYEHLILAKVLISYSIDSINIKNKVRKELNIIYNI